MGLSPPLYQIGMRQFHDMPAVMPAPHFYLKGWPDPDGVRRRYGHGHIEAWPYFDKVGGYEGLAEAMREEWSRRAIGVVVSRPD